LRNFRNAPYQGSTRVFRNRQPRGNFADDDDDSFGGGGGGNGWR